MREKRKSILPPFFQQTEINDAKHGLEKVSILFSRLESAQRPGIDTLFNYSTTQFFSSFGGESVAIERVRQRNRESLSVCVKVRVRERESECFERQQAVFWRHIFDAFFWFLLSCELRATLGG